MSAGMQNIHARHVRHVIQHRKCVAGTPLNMFLYATRRSDEMKNGVVGPLLALGEGGQDPFCAIMSPPPFHQVCPHTPLCTRGVDDFLGSLVLGR